MTFTAEQKSQLAKLMATENLTVQHQKIHTAKFDPINRVLYLPIWQNMSGDLYDLLTGHEVGHALYTPADGWHSAASDKSKPASYKNFLNVVEDARIEKKVKRRYPGLKLSFQKAYKELFDRDFFGLRGRNTNDMAFIDRLNVFTKSQYTADWIQFSPEERKFINQIESLETWDDVVRLTDSIFEYSKDEQFEMQNYDFDYAFDESDGEDEDSYDFDMDSPDDKDSGDQGLKSKSSNKSDSDEDAEGQEDGDSDKEESTASDVDAEVDSESESGKINRDKQSSLTDKDQFTPECVTDEEFRKRENLLLDEKSQPYVYVNIPKYNKKYSVTPAKRVIEQIEDFYTKPNEENYIRMEPDKVRELVNNFKNRNERFIGLLVKEFEMRKAAKAYSKSKLADTGDIDINKLSSYKFDDNIFRKVMLTPKGKNHGLILLLDKSGSMADNLPGSIEQILILSMFCRKVNIPFIVYGFGGETESYRADHGHKEYGRIFSTDDKDLQLTPVFMREYLNSSMSNSEFTKAVRALLCLKLAYEIRWYSYPQSERLSNTPLNEAIIATGHIMREFRKQYNLDLSSLIIVHDGDSDTNNRYYAYDEQYERIRYHWYDTNYSNVIVQDVQNKFQCKLESRFSKYDPLLLCTLKWFEQVTNSKVFGFFLTSGGRQVKSSIAHRYVFEDGEHYDTKHYAARRAGTFKEVDALEEKLNTIVKQFKTEKFVACKTRGYHDFFIIAGGEELTTENEEIEIEGKVTASKLKNAFMKYNKKRSVNRVLVSRFIQGIAA